VLNLDIHDRLAAAQAFKGEVAQVLADIAERVRQGGDGERAGKSASEGRLPVAEWWWSRRGGAQPAD